jgi:hypothetical protein
MKYPKLLLILVVLLSAIQTFAQVDGNPTNWCRNGLFPQDSDDFKIARIKGAKNEKAYFYKDEDDCPDGKKCRAKSYLISGDEVIVSRNFGKYACSWYQPKMGAETVGWILSEKLELVEQNKNPELNAWIGEWKYYDNSIEIIISNERGSVNIAGNALWKGLGDNVHIGELDSVSKPDGSILKIGEAETDEYACKVTMRLVGKFLIASDNLNCGGANVTFTGVYRRK